MLPFPGPPYGWQPAGRSIRLRAFASQHSQIVLEESIEAVRLAERRLDRVDGYLPNQISSWSRFALVRNLYALRGIDVIASAGPRRD